MPGPWMSAGTDEPRDKQADLISPYWAVIGPDDPDDGWSWTVVDSSRDGEDAASGKAPDEAAAKDAVVAWEQQEAAWQMGDGKTDDDLRYRFGPGWRAYRRPEAAR